MKKAPSSMTPESCGAYRFHCSGFLVQATCNLSLVGVESSGVLRSMRGCYSHSHIALFYINLRLLMKEEEMEQWLTFVTWFFRTP